MAERDLVMKLGAEYTQMLMASIPRMERALARGFAPALLRVDLLLEMGEDGSVRCTMKPTEKIKEPRPSKAEVKMALQADGQLALFEGEGT